jgi:hypothetical protein
VLKQLVARLIERCLGFYFAATLTISRIGHESWVCVGSREAEKYGVMRAAATGGNFGALRGDNIRVGGGRAKYTATWLLTFPRRVRSLDFV